jgi:methylmalonyl-CoA mutase cobalamin-binding subunit
MARRAGLHVVYLGPDLPVADWLRAVDRSDAAVAVIAVVSGRDLEAATEVATTLQQTFPDLVVVFGGAAAVELPDPAAPRRLPQDLVAATTVLRGLLPHRPERRRR